MGMIVDLDLTSFMYDRSLKFTCKGCGNTFSDTSGRKPNCVKVEFKDVKVPKLRCPVCDCETFDVSAHIEPYFCINEFMDKDDQEKDNNEVDNEDEEETEEMDNVS